MEDAELFQKALVAVDGRITDLAKECRVSRVTAWSWRNIAEGLKPNKKLPMYARIRLRKAAGIEEPQ